MGVILAGGAATRMGADKAMFAFAGKPMIDHVAAALEEAGLAVVIAGRAGLVRGHHAIPDIRDYGGGGPALGLASVLRRFPRTDVFMAAVDQPLLRPATVRELMKISGDAVVPEAGTHPQVTCAVYRHQCLPVLEEMLREGESKLRSLLPRVTTTLVPETRWTAWGEDGRSWRSLDTPEEVRDAEALL